MKCGVCFHLIKVKSDVCPFCYYVATDLTKIPPRRYVDVVMSPGYQAFGEMLKKCGKLDPIELRMKLYRDSKDNRMLGKLLRYLKKKVESTLLIKEINSGSRTVLEAKLRKLSNQIINIGASHE
jgi:hypothetical protein